VLEESEDEQRDLEEGCQGRLEDSYLGQCNQVVEDRCWLRPESGVEEARQEELTGSPSDDQSSANSPMEQLVPITLVKCTHY
jgi:hypothetical protein